MALIAIKPTLRQRRMEALRALARKVRLEAKLRSEMLRFFKAVNTRVAGNIRRGEELPPLANFDKRLERILIAHSNRVTKEFADPVATIREDDDTVKMWGGKVENKQTPDRVADKEEPDDSKRDIAEALALLIAGAVATTKTNVLKTLQSDIGTAIDRARQAEEAARLAAEETTLPAIPAAADRKKIAKLTQSALTARAVSRSDTIATTTTQALAEGAKQAVRTVLLQSPDVDTQAAGIKTWTTMGDNLVRDTHIAADAQERPIDQPFDLAGGQLMFPTDGSLGADVSELANCRCSAPSIFFNPAGLEGVPRFFEP